ncbi:MAG: hypothetical protein WBK75_01050 [Acutalibacteraceae bacterium]
MEMIYTAIKYITFPGAVFKAFLEHLTCRLYEVPVEDIRSLQPNELCGHIEHELVRGRKSFGVCFLPFILSLICGLLVLTPAAINIIYLGQYNIISIFLMYFGISLLTNMFPMVEDVYSMWESLYGQGSTAKKSSKILLAIPATIMYIGALLENFGITFLTSILFAFVLPNIIASFI